MAIRFEDDDKRISLSVRDLVERLSPQGDLRLGVMGSQARMAVGRAVHEDEQAARMDEESSYDAEVSVRFSLMVGEWECVIRGRMDGLAEDEDGVFVEEIKSSLLPGEVIEQKSASDWPHWEDQVALYVWLLEAMGRGPASGHLVVISVLDGTRVLLPVEVNLQEVGEMVQQRLEELVRGREDWIGWRTHRAGQPVPFAHSDFREGQLAMAKEAMDAVYRGQQLLLDAPTGAGKTAAVLQGVLEACAKQGWRVFYATAKGTQREMVERTLSRMVEQGMPIRAVSLTAREKLCLNEVVDCRPESCRFAQGHFDRLREGEVLQSTLDESIVPTHRLLGVGESQQLCPHALGNDVAHRADIVVGDYNYVFDPRMSPSWLVPDWDKWVVVVDEAHNLVERARGYASPRLDARLAYEAEYWLADTYGSAATPHARFCKELALWIEGCWVLSDLEQEGEWESSFTEESVQFLASQANELALHYTLLKVRASAVDEDPYQSLLRMFHHFVERLRVAGEETLQLYGHQREGGSWVRLLCLDPSRMMRRQFQDFEAAILMSATLRPAAYHQDLLGLDADRCVYSEHLSGFSTANRGVYLATRVSTAYRDREAHRKKTGELIRSIIEASPGHTAIYYSSYAMLGALAPLTAIEGVLALQQTANMRDADHRLILETLGGEEQPVALHAVLGGLFSEGVDLPAGCLKTVVVVGPALPPVGVEREKIRDWCEERYGEGFAYAFLVPGMSRVIQAAGRIVRSADDRGAVVLVGRRFGWRDYRKMLPEDWAVERVEEPALSVADFWQSADATAELG